MTRPGRWLRLDVTWDHSEWVCMLSAEGQLAWIKLLCHVKTHGVQGEAKAISPAVAARHWGVSPAAVEEMEEAARQDGALYRENGAWVVTAWNEYQKPDATNADRQRRWRASHRNGA